MAQQQPAHAMRWCEANAASPFQPAMARSSLAMHKAMHAWGFSASSFNMGYRPSEVAEVCARAMGMKRPRARYLCCRGPFLWLLWLSRALPTEFGDVLMARV